MKNFQDLISSYIDTVTKEKDNTELYKWKAIQHFQANWKLDCQETEFYEMFKKALAKRENLIFQNSFGFLNSLAKEMPKQAQELFAILFNDEILLEKRFADYQRYAIELLPLVKEKTGKYNLNHQQDERTMAFLLTLHNPEIYFLYKDNVYQWLCELKQAKPKEARQKYDHFRELAQDELSLIRENAALQTATASFIPSEFQFDSTNLIFQDILYRSMPASKAKRKEFFKELVLRVEDYLYSIDHPLCQHVWTNDAPNYRWISVWKTIEIDPYFLHYEIIHYEDYLSVELHPEGNRAFKEAFEPFMSFVDSDKHITKKWLNGLEKNGDGDFHKIISKSSACRYKNETEPTKLQIELVAKQLMEFYESYQVKIEQYLNQIKFSFSSMKPYPKMKTPLNQILYGPPGTGKTYCTTTHALSIVEETSVAELEKEPVSELIKRYNAYRSKKIIDFVTFHQSYGYEEFIEGIKPILKKVDETEEKEMVNSIHYKIEDGVFKEMCANAESYNDFSYESKDNYTIDPALLNDKGFHKISLGNTSENSGDLIYNYCKENGCIAIGWGGDDVDYTGVKDRKEIKERFVNAGYDAKDVFNINAIERLALWIKKGDIIFVSHGNKILKAVGIVEGDYEHRPNSTLPFHGYNHFRKVKWLITDAHIPVHEVYYANFSQQSIYTMWSNKINKDFFRAKKNDKKVKNHVLIIDEINRGNVSAIFGELITLIEEDKRKNKPNELSTTLPYSKEPFSVPQNLYLLGTMNTADRSVEALDTALRRRFAFTEMMPQPHLVSPSAILSRLMWNYSEVPWEDQEYSSKEAALKELFGITDEDLWKKRKETWLEQMRGKDQSTLTHLNYLNSCSTLNLQTLLETINSRIEILIDRDHTIGHAYFMEVEDIAGLKFTFKNKIIPLLQEYFYGDYHKIEMVIGPHFFKEEQAKPNFQFAVKNVDLDIEKRIYEFKDIGSETFDILDAIKRLYTNQES